MLLRLRQRLVAVPDRDHGAVAVEAALITPLFLLLVFGMVDLSLLIKDKLAVVSASRAGARTASSLAHQPTFLTTTAAQVSRATAAVNRVASVDGLAPDGRKATQLWVYKAGASGAPPASCSTGLPNPCVRFVWNGTAFTASAAELALWPSSAVNACPVSTTNPNGPDAVGVFVTTPHSFLTPIWTGHFDEQDYTVLNFEPVPLGVAGNGCAAS